MNLSFPEKELLDVKYKYHQRNFDLKKEYKNEAYYRTKHFRNENSNSKINVVVMGSSMNENLMRFLPKSFYDLKYFRLNDVKDVPYEDEYKLLKRYKDDIISLKPDIFILSVTSENLHALFNLAEE